MSFREDWMIIFTTHVFRSFSCSHRALIIKFLNEADLLTDHIAILATSGKIIASGWPVSLRRDGEVPSDPKEMERTRMHARG